QLRTIARNIAKVEAPTPELLKITLKDIDPDFLQELCDYYPKILAAHVAKNAGNPTGDALRDLYNKTAVGTGPYKVRNFDKTRATELERFDDYWDGKPFMDGLRIIYRMDFAAQQAAFITGE